MPAVAACTAMTTLTRTSRSSALWIEATLASRHHTLSSDRRMDQSGRIPLARQRRRVSSVRETKVLMDREDEDDGGDSAGGVVVASADDATTGGLITSHRQVFDHTYASRE